MRCQGPADRGQSYSRPRCCPESEMIQPPGLGARGWTHYRWGISWTVVDFSESRVLDLKCYGSRRRCGSSPFTASITSASDMSNAFRMSRAGTAWTLRCPSASWVKRLWVEMLPPRRLPVWSLVCLCWNASEPNLEVMSQKMSCLHLQGLCRLLAVPVALVGASLRPHLFCTLPSAPTSPGLHERTRSILFSHTSCRERVFVTGSDLPLCSSTWNANWHLTWAWSGFQERNVAA